MSLKFSIVTCTWNSLPYLADSIKSVLSQNYSNVEYIFVDGGSTDGTLESIRAIPSEIKLIENVRGGIARAMNAGIKAATGDIIAHLHSDDYYANSNVLSRVAQEFQQTGASWLFGRCETDIEGLRSFEGYAVPEYSFNRLIKRNFIPHPATFISRSLFDKNGHFDETIKYAMDYDLWLRFGKNTEPVQLDEHLAVFRWHPGSLTSSNRMESFNDDFRIRMRHVEKTPWSIAYHWAHYFVRRRRLIRLLSSVRGQI